LVAAEGEGFGRGDFEVVFGVLHAFEVFAVQEVYFVVNLHGAGVGLEEVVFDSDLVLEGLGDGEGVAFHFVEIGFGESLGYGF
jgi:hypothetical protein